MSLTACCATMFCVRLVEVLAHSLWQGFALYFLAAAGARKIKSARWRCAVFRTALVMLVVAPILTFLLAGPLLPTDFSRFQRVLDPSGAGDYSVWALLFSSPSSQSAELRLTTAAVVHTPDLLQCIRAIPRAGWRVLAPLAAAIYFSVLLVLLLRASKHLEPRAQQCTDLHPCYDPGWMKTVRACAVHYALRYEPTVFSGKQVAGAVLLGAYHPAIALPTSLVEDAKLEMAAARVDQMLRAIRHHLGAWLLLEKIVQIGYFYHPAARWIVQRIEKDREACFAAECPPPGASNVPSQHHAAVEFHAKGHRHHAKPRPDADAPAAQHFAAPAAASKPAKRRSGKGRSVGEAASTAPISDLAAAVPATSAESVTPSLCLTRNAPLSALACMMLLALAGALFVARVPADYPPKLLNIESSGPAPYELGVTQRVRIVASSSAHPVVAVVDKCRFLERAGIVTAEIGLTTFHLERSSWQLSVTVMDKGGAPLRTNFEVVQVAAADPSDWISADPEARRRATLDIEMGEAAALANGATYRIEWKSLDGHPPSNTAQLISHVG